MKDITTVMTGEDLNGLIASASLIDIPGKVQKYLLEIVAATRNAAGVSLGASPVGQLAYYEQLGHWLRFLDRSFVMSVEVQEGLPSVGCSSVGQQMGSGCGSGERNEGRRDS